VQELLVLTKAYSKWLQDEQTKTREEIAVADVCPTVQYEMHTKPSQVIYMCIDKLVCVFVYPHVRVVCRWAIWTQRST